MISIITPVYNGEKFIESCLQNVINQNFAEVEHIIADGGSTDKTIDIIKHYANQHPHIRWISEKDQGQSDAMNKGIAMAQGAIIGILNVDDFYEPNVLSRISELFTNLPEPTLIVGNCNIWDHRNNLIQINKPKRLQPVDLLMEKQINDDGMIDVTFPVNPSAYFYHKSLHQKIGVYKVEEHYVMDIDFLLKAVKVAHVKYFNELWGNFRYYPGTKTFDDSINGTNETRIQHLFKEYAKTLPLIEQWKIHLNRIILFITLRIFYFSKYPQRLPQSIMNRFMKSISYFKHKTAIIGDLTHPTATKRSPVWRHAARLLFFIKSRREIEVISTND
ncbi:glycosyltransferase family 2 protein [Nostoc sp. NMS8]|uniref:glycosyltransferase family 2 protein n=1 Tax=Nostoc sp. NMS8 TaxID=2815392 RepID=UPI0025EFE801|nr:glycosyltransferase family 2 protein [Nostoc sp. NMS8]MBN3961619.1 glycosyltransferase [Nostoc sp. NMS8]